MGDIHFYDDTDENALRVEQFAGLLKQVSGHDPGAHRRMDAMDVEWRYPGASFNPWCCLTVPLDPPIEWVEIEFNSVVSPGKATVEQVNTALKWFTDMMVADVFKSYRAWAKQQRDMGRKIYTPQMRYHWRTYEQSSPYYQPDEAVNSFIWADQFNNKVERCTQLNWGGHDWPWNDTETWKKDDDFQHLVFTTTRSFKLKPTQEAELRTEITRLYTHQAAAMRRFVNNLDQLVTKVTP